MQVSKGRSRRRAKNYGRFYTRHSERHLRSRRGVSVETDRALTQAAPSAQEVPKYVEVQADQLPCGCVVVEVGQRI